MTLGIGAYRVGDGATRLKRTSVISKAFDNLDRAGNFTTEKQISVDTAKDILGQLGLSPKKMNKILQGVEGEINYHGAHGAIQMSSGGKQVYAMVESLRRPISSFISDNVSKLAKAIFR